MKQKIFLAGKVYDLSSVATPDIEKSVQNTILDWIGVNVLVRVKKNPQDKKVEITCMRGLNMKFDEGEVNDDDYNLIIGPKPKYDFFIPHFPSMNYYYRIDDVKNIYNENAKAAGGNKIKEMEYVGNPEQFTLTLVF